MPPRLPHGGASAGMTAAPLRFSVSTFRILQNAATTIGFDANLNQDQREPFENLLAQLTSTQGEYRPTELVDIIEATNVLKERLCGRSSSDQLETFHHKRRVAAAETLSSVHEGRQPRTPVLDRQVGYGQGSNTAFPNVPGALTPSYSDKGGFGLSSPDAECKLPSQSLI